MISFNITLSSVLKKAIEKLSEQSALAMCYEQASSVIGVMKNRIHVEGKAADDSQIGTYSDGYMKVRTNSFASPTVVRGKSKGSSRPSYNRTASTTVVASLTSAMEMDMEVIPITNGYGIGYRTSDSFQKSMYVEARYGKAIFSLSNEEREIATSIAKRYIKNMVE